MTRITECEKDNDAEGSKSRPGGGFHQLPTVGVGRRPLDDKVGIGGVLDTPVVEGVAVDVVGKGTIRVVDEGEGTEEQSDNQDEDEEGLVELH